MPERPPGPHLQISTFAREVERGANLTVRHFVTAVDPTREGGMPVALEGLPLFLVISLWADRAAGLYTMTIQADGPDGEPFGDPIVGTFNFQPGTGGVDFIRKIPFVVREEGIYWFNVFVGKGAERGPQLTRIPLRIEDLRS